MPDPTLFTEWGPLGALVFLVAIFLAYQHLSEKRRADTWAASARENHRRYEEMSKSCHDAQDRATEAIKDVTKAVAENTLATRELRADLRRNGRSG